MKVAITPFCQYQLKKESLTDHVVEDYLFEETDDELLDEKNDDTDINSDESKNETLGDVCQKKKIPHAADNLWEGFHS